MAHSRADAAGASRPERTLRVTGPEHYQEAERLLELARSVTGPRPTPWVAENIAAARAHATLALAAASALGGVQDPDKWLDAAG
jgi:hypothetical protein